MRFGLDIAQQRLDWAELLDRARFAEDLGFDGVWGFDHLEPMYGSGPGNCFEGMTTLAALAAATTRVRLGLLVAGMTYRHPCVYVAEALTVDHVSKGRLELSFGAAWYGDEHARLGIPFPPIGERIDRLEDSVTAARLLMSGEVVSYRGRTLELDGARMRPLPVQRPTPPIWIGASGERRTLPLAGRLADVWHCFGEPAALDRKWTIVARAAEAAGRDPAAILRAASLSLGGDLDTVRRDAAAHAAVGTGYLVCGWPEEGRGRVEEFVAQVASAFVA